MRVSIYGLSVFDSIPVQPHRQTFKGMKTITYIYRGGIEVGTGEPGYEWRDGYSPNNEQGHMTAPWMTKRECYADAKAKGAKAVFEVPAGRLPKDQP